ncbi:hypothetical protein CsSME_00035780 [Camellia sinensis var. sinensis]
MAHLLLIFMLCLLIIACSSKLVLGHSVVESLPGFEGPLPFELETGYVGINAYRLSYFWNNNDRVREALHIRKGSITEWIRCNKLSYTITIWDSFQYHVNLSTKW